MNAVTKQEGGGLALTESELIGVLQSSLYPGAELPSIKMVIEYCRAAGLDPMQKPVHIVPMWDSKASKMRDVIMPGVNLYRTQAARSGQFAGMSEPEFGPAITTKLGGVEITYPEWCKVTVKRALVSGAIAEFAAIEYWIENYAVKGGKEKSIAPNAMWQKRPRGQIAKCAAAQALRIAFPEIASQPTADEMEGKTIYANESDAVINFPSEDLKKLLKRVDEAKTEAEVTAIWTSGVTDIKESKDMHAYAEFKAAVTAKGKALKEAPAKPAAPAEIDSFVAAMDAADPTYIPE